MIDFYCVSDPFSMVLILVIFFDDWIVMLFLFNTNVARYIVTLKYSQSSYNTRIVHFGTNKKLISS